ncbi:MAG: sulfatase-like hydrolase/transferase, partial [Desulfatirhabdiaceae bacterium]
MFQINPFNKNFLKDIFNRLHQTRYGFVGFVLLSLLAVDSILRIALFISFKPTSPVSIPVTIETFGIGFFMDFFVGLVTCLPLLFWMLMISNSWFKTPLHRIWFGFWICLFFGSKMFLLAVEYFFFEEFKSRFNTVAVDYLLFPYEVFVNIWDQYPIVWIVGVIAILAIIWYVTGASRYRNMWETAIPFRFRLMVFVGVILLCTLLWPVAGQKLTRFSSERLINELANNGWFSFVSAAITRELDYSAFYRTLPIDDAYAETRRMLTEPGTRFVETGRSIRRSIDGDPNRPKLNVVILLEESLGAEFFGCLGRTAPSLTPEMDRLAKQDALLFTHIYATGNRTARGMEGVLSSFPPLPGDSITARTRSENVETIARVLKRDGYSTLFIYGGRKIFDNVGSFTTRNGYDRLIEQNDFQNPAFATIWGVSNEDL